MGRLLIHQRVGRQAKPVGAHAPASATHDNRCMSNSTHLRMIEEADAPALTEHLNRDREAFAPWEPSRPAHFYTEIGQRERIAELLAGHANGTTWPGVIHADGAVVGQLTISTIVRGPIQKGFLGYWVAVPHQNSGHATEAVRQALDLMHRALRLHRAEAHTQLENIASQTVLRKNGFQSWGTASQHILIDGMWRDELFWERILPVNAA